MSSRKWTFFLKILAVIFATVFYFTEATVAQFHQQRLIRLLEPKELLGAADVRREEPIEIEQQIPARSLVVYGRGKTNTDVGIVPSVDYRPILYSREPQLKENGELNLDRMPDLETFFQLGGTVELLTTDTTLEKYDIVMSELMWGIDTGLRDTTVSITIDDGQKIYLPYLVSQEVQWIEFYNTTTENITSDLYLLFTPFVSYPDRETVRFEGGSYTVLDTLNNLLFGRWELPGKSGRRPTTAFVSTYRNIDYDLVENENLSRETQLTGIPFGSYEDSWKETPDEGRRNTELRIIQGTRLVTLPYIATPGMRHVSELYVKPLKSSDVDSDLVVINEVYNDTSRDNVDWIELKNVSLRAINLEEWELSIVTAVGEDIDLVDLPAYNLERNEILLVVNKHPNLTNLADGINIEDSEKYRRLTGLSHKYFVSEDLDLPENKTFLLLLRSKNDKNGKDEAIEDYAGNGFFSDDFTTQFWPRLAQPTPTNVADFGDNSFASRRQAWARIRYKENDGHHENAWQIVEAQGGIGYASRVDLDYAPGTPGYENDGIKTQLENKISSKPDTEYDDGEISISEIMYDPGPNRAGVQWIELYNSSLTQAINLKGWELAIRNLDDETGTYVNSSFEFKDAVILPNQALLLVSKVALTDVPDNRIYNLYRNHRRELGLRPAFLLNPTAFYLKLTDKADPERRDDDIIVDEVGNLKVEAGIRTKGWDLPLVNPKKRRSFVRLYGAPFKWDSRGLGDKSRPPNQGMALTGWRLFSLSGLSLSFYGHRDDLASPGYRMGGPVPVVLANFRPVRMETGEVLIKWKIESELNNAGFNILRSENPEGEFKVINIKGIIPGRGTSSEIHNYFYTDTTAKSNVVYYYRIEGVCFDGVRQMLATVRLKGDISPTGKLIKGWGHLKTPR